MRVIARIIFGVTSLSATGAIAELLPLKGFFEIVVAILIALPLVLLVIVVHELGHAWAVRRLGGRVTGFTILGVDFIGSSAAVDPRLSGREIGGHVDFEFEGGETPHEHALIAAAGPGANLLLALAAGLAAWTMTWTTVDSRPVPVMTTTTTVASAQPPSGGGPRLRSDDEVRQWARTSPWGRSGSGDLANLLAALAVLSAGIGLANLVPFKGSDGAALKHALTPAWRR